MLLWSFERYASRRTQVKSYRRSAQEAKRAKWRVNIREATAKMEEENSIDSNISAIFAPTHIGRRHPHSPTDFEWRRSCCATKSKIICFAGPARLSHGMCRRRKTKANRHWIFSQRSSPPSSSALTIFLAGRWSHKFCVNKVASRVRFLLLRLFVFFYHHFSSFVPFVRLSVVPHWFNSFAVGVGEATQNTNKSNETWDIEYLLKCSSASFVLCPSYDSYAQTPFDMANCPLKTKIEWRSFPEGFFSVFSDRPLNLQHAKNRSWVLLWPFGKERKHFSTCSFMSVFGHVVCCGQFVFLRSMFVPMHVKSMLVNVRVT